MDRIAIALFALVVAVAPLVSGAPVAVPKVTGLDTAVGFSWTDTRVAILGENLVTQSVNCMFLCSGTPCPVTVFFGTREAMVRQAYDHAIIADAPAQSEGTVVDVIVRLPGNPDIVLPKAFRYEVSAQPSSANYVRHLVPLTRDLAGANGSQWVTQWTMVNPYEIPVIIPGTNCPPNVSPCVTPWSIAPRQMQAMYPLPRTSPGEGAFVYLPLSLSEVGGELRVRDISRSAEGWGTELPVVSYEDFHETIWLLDVPTDPRFRSTLRIYGPTEAQAQVRLKIYPRSGRTPIVEQLVDLRGLDVIEPTPFPTQPSYAQLDPITEAVRASGEPRVRIQVSYEMPPFTNPPVTLPIWAFVSLTNNVTQQVTAITPHL